MRLVLLCVLLAGCAAQSTIPDGGYTTKNGAAPEPGEMLKDWNECHPAAALALLGGALAQELNKSSAVDCMAKKGWK